MHPSQEVDRRQGEIEMALQNLSNITEELEMTFAGLSERIAPVLSSEDNVKGANSGNELNPAHPVPMVNSIDAISTRVRRVLNSMRSVQNRVEI